MLLPSRSSSSRRVSSSSQPAPASALPAGTYFRGADVRPRRNTPLRSVPRTLTAARRQTAFAGLDPPGTWPRSPRAPRPERLDLGLATLPGVAATTQRKLGRLGLANVRDVLEHRPRRYETAADEVAIA